VSGASHPLRHKKPRRREVRTIETRLNSRARLSRNLTLTSVFAGLYAALVVVFAGNSVYPFQVRVADVLMPLAILFGWPAIFGLALGAAIGNLGADALSGFPGLSIGIDIVGGALANLLAGFLAWKIGGLRLRAAGRVCWALGSIALTGVMIIALGPFVFWGWILLLAIIASGLLAYIARRRGWNTEYNISWPLATVVESIVISLVVGSYLGVILPFPESTQAAIVGVLLGSVVAVNLGGTALLGAIAQSGTLKTFRSWGVAVYGTQSEKGRIEEETANPSSWS
jgi:hypothetical protein